jgi:hypothetical protein
LRVEVIVIEGIARVRILDAMAEGLVVFATRFVSVLKIYALSWLVAVAVTVGIDLIWFHNVRQLAPDWLNGVLWSFAIAPSVVLVLLFGLDRTAPQPFIGYHWDRFVFLAGLIVAAWSVLDSLSEWFSSYVFQAIIQWYYGIYGALRTNELSFWTMLAFRSIGWLDEIFKAV